MPKLERAYQPVFGNQGNNDEFAVFGTMKSGTPVYSKTVPTLFQSPAFLQGWQNAVAADKAPFLEEMNGLFYALSSQLAYLFQQGLPEWDPDTTYYANTSFCQVNGVVYKSLTDENIGNNPTEDTTSWEEFNAGNSDSTAFGMSQYLPENDYGLSWYRSTGENETKAHFPAWYNWVLTNYNAGKSGFKLSTDATLSDYDWGINPTDETFRPPLKNHTENIPDYANKIKPIAFPYTAPADGIIMAGQLTDAGKFSGFSYVIEGEEWEATRAQYNYNSAGGGSRIPSSILVEAGQIIDVKRGGDDESPDARYTTFVPFKGNGVLYWYCGNTPKNQELIDMSQMQTQISNLTATKANKSPFIPKYAILNSSNTAGTYNIDLNEYLPPDDDPNAQYEVDLLYYQAQSYSQTAMWECIIKSDIYDTGFYAQITNVGGTNAASQYYPNKFTLVVGSQRSLQKILIRETGAGSLTTSNLYAYGYRKIN